MRELLRTAFEQFVLIGIGLAEAIIVFFVATMVARALRRIVRRRLHSALAPDNVKRLAENVVTFAVFGGGATILLTFWGVTWTTLLTAIGLSTLVVALGLQSVLQSLIGGFFILFERPFSAGDRIMYSIHDVNGTVEEIALRSTVVRDDEGARIVVPNSLVLTNAVINYSPERAVMTIVTVHAAGGDGRTFSDTGAVATAALADMAWPATSPTVTVYSRLRDLHMPRLVVRIPRLGLRLEKWMGNMIDESTQVRVTWTGLNDPDVREQVLTRLSNAFANSRVTVRRW